MPIVIYLHKSMSSTLVQRGENLYCEMGKINKRRANEGWENDRINKNGDLYCEMGKKEQVPQSQTEGDCFSLLTALIWPLNLHEREE